MRRLTFLSCFIQVVLLRGVFAAVVVVLPPLAGAMMLSILVFVVVKHFVEDVFVVLRHFGRQ
ncbi:hypothetical protein BO83DRAFT_375451 [Aspergillus eucalypticola CBS 122712]|uniref:Uncharacterized protein n=1 Tax=Aspergillus eucalypticola (strain CBS 122712 / IBT 29274) TaxID=1448314 RepID=A0A317W7L5_ASPEC|nr:uncharacterized protein BO83DRAFT_375451 [Aspergillus eucalypticola CBS 122712]PWY81242.1 hypothetical protein BO83DRAFT_375451 [Aspergillus eucalypticola CBS 122712]